MTKHLQNCGPNTQEFDPVSLTWVAKTHTKTERVHCADTDTWSDQPIVEPTPAPKKKAKKKVSKKK